VEWARVVAEGNAAVHAAAGLHPELVGGQRQVDLLIVGQSLRNRAIRSELAPVLDEGQGIRH
jgi:hypothetical protein